MHLALPPRTPYARPSKASPDRRRRQLLQYAAYLVFGVFTLYLLLDWLLGDYAYADDAGVPLDASVAIVTVLDEATMSKEYVEIIKENRDDYAKRHGYKNFYTNITTYSHLTKPSPSSWSMIPALRHSLTLYPEVDYIWYLTPHALIMKPHVSLYEHVLVNLTNLMQKDVPVVPPDSVIHTFSHLKPSQVFLILSQDGDNVAHTSFILRNTNKMPVPYDQPKENWAHYFLDAWFDPLYRAYAFQKAENHALEHIVQWHPTVLAKLAMVDQRLINSYNTQSDKSEVELEANRLRGMHDSQYRKGDLLVNFRGCAESKDRDCEQEIKDFYTDWKRIAGQTT